MMKSLIFCMTNKFLEIKTWCEIIGLGVVKYGCGHSGHMTLQLAVFQEGINGIKWFIYMVIQSQESEKLL